MARLNEPAMASTETIDALKRKYLRQNRDLARANSTQSLRIRSLENEVSRLLSENLGFREQIGRLQGELENGRAQRIAESMGGLKAQLEAKLLELGALITGLGDEPVPRKIKTPKGKLIRNSPAGSPDQRNWKNSCTLSETLAGQEGRLPPILENKSYPRRTLEREEIINIATDIKLDSTDSPEIGPPPVSQFVNEDPVKIDLPRRSKMEEKEDLSGLDPALSVNLEQRRKKKDSTGASELRRSSRIDEVPQEPVDQGSPEIPESVQPSKVDGIAPKVVEVTKTGGKRKLGVREDEEVPPGSGASTPDGFTFTRVEGEERRSRNKSQPRSENINNRATKDSTGGLTKERNLPANVCGTRRILAPKSVNDSPRKVRSGISFQDKASDAKPTKQDPVKPTAVKEPPRERREEPVSMLPPNEPLLQTVELQPCLEPETPAGLDLFSPLSSHPSTARAESRDTPPPSEISAGADASRPSRRARGAVSYAEPNLRDKMRRPTKELVDAVARDQKAARENALKVEDRITTDQVRIKSEPGMIEGEDAWKSMPAATSTTVENSPLSNKVSVPELLPSTITTPRKRRESLLAQSDMECVGAGSATATAALLAETRKAKGPAREKSAGDDNTKVLVGADIYEFTGSPPISEDLAKQPLKQEKPAVLRVSRRQTSVLRDTHSPSDGEVSDIEGTKRSDSTASRRRQSTLGLVARSSSTASLRPADHSSERSSALKRSTSTTAMSESTTGLSRSASDSSRSDRISARRRSMMI